MNLKLTAIASNLEHEKGIKLEIRAPFKQYLLDKAKQDLSNGGRGIGNMVETCLVNPLAQVLIKEQWGFGDALVIEDKPLNDELQFKYIIRQSEQDK